MHDIVFMGDFDSIDQLVNDRDRLFERDRPLERLALDKFMTR